MSELEMDHRKLEVDHRKLRDQVINSFFKDRTIKVMSNKQFLILSRPYHIFLIQGWIGPLS